MRLLTENNHFAQPQKPAFKRRKTASSKPSPARRTTPPSSDTKTQGSPTNNLSPNPKATTDHPSPSAYQRELAELEDHTTRLTNAYPGATNSINSIHQRRWYLSLDRHSSGFVPKYSPSNRPSGRTEWVRRLEGGQLLGFEPFFVRGREVERSVVTGRLAGEVLRDEGVEGYVGRRGWRAVLE